MSNPIKGQDWKVEITDQPDDLRTLTISGLTRPQVEMIRCMLQIDYEVDPVEDWGLEEEVEGHLQGFRLDLADAIEGKGY